jgi:glycosyltransferase involved in cell wall biosynthesis
MKIAVISSPIITTPPVNYGGMERICYWLARDLVRMGHEVTLLGRTGSYLDNGRVIGYIGNGEDDGFAEVCCQADDTYEFDILHDITHDKKIVGRRSDKMHKTINTLQAMARRGPNTTCISQAQRRELGYEDHVPVVYNRVPTAEYPPIKNPTADYLLYCGSINDYKGVDIAIDACKRANQKLIIAGVAWDPQYFDKFVKPEISDQIIWYGETGGEEKLSLIQNAKALIHPVRWCEAGAIIVSEALSCGVPIIGSNNGVLPELIIPAVGNIASVEHFDHGYPHMLGGCYDVDGMMRAIETINNIDRNDCAEYARIMLDCSKSAEEYVQVYSDVLGGKQWQ